MPVKLPCKKVWNAYRKKRGWGKLPSVRYIMENLPDKRKGAK